MNTFFDQKLPKNNGKLQQVQSSQINIRSGQVHSRLLRLTGLCHWYSVEQDWWRAVRAFIRKNLSKKTFLNALNLDYHAWLNHQHSPLAIHSAEQFVTPLVNPVALRKSLILFMKFKFSSISSHFLLLSAKYVKARYCTGLSIYYDKFSSCSLTLK